MMVRAPRAVDLLRKYELNLARRPTTQASHFLAMMVRAPRAVGRHRGTSRRRHLAPIHLGSRFTQIG